LNLVKITLITMLLVGGDHCDSKIFMKKPPRPGRAGSKHKDAGCGGSDAGGMCPAGANGRASGEPEVKRRRNSSRAGAKKDELDDILDAGSGSKFRSLMRPGWGARPHGLPAPMLDPRRMAPGLYNNLMDSSKTLMEDAVATPAPSRSHHQQRVNIGKEFQCTALPRCKKDGAGYKEKEAATLCWSSRLDGPAVDNFVAWAVQSSNLPGPRRTTEEALTLLNHFQGDIQVIYLLIIILFYYN